MYPSEHHLGEGLAHSLGSGETSIRRHGRMTADTAGQKYCKAASGLLDRPLPAAGIIRAELHHVARQDRRMRCVAAQHSHFTFLLFYHCKIELWINSSQ